MAESEEQSIISDPSFNPAEANDLSGVLDVFQRVLFQKIEKVAPAQIVSYDRQTNRATVQVLNYAITSTGEKLARKPLTDIPVSVFGGYGLCLSIPIKSGDIGFLIASDGDISVFKKLLQIFAPATYQKHKYKDGIFFPLIINGFTFSNDDENALLLTSTDGATKISIKDKVITINADNVNVNATTAQVTAESTLTGNLTVDGNISSTKSITAAGTVTGASLVDLSGATGTYTSEVTTQNGIVKSGS